MRLTLLTVNMSCMLYNYYKPRASVNDYSDYNDFTASMFSAINIFDEEISILSYLL